MIKMQNGFTLAELLVATSIGAIISLVAATFFSFAAEEFYSLVDQNEAEQSMLLASYYLRSTLAQAIKTMTTTSAIQTVFTGTPENTVAPPNVALGYIRTDLTCANASCTSMTNPWPAGWPAGAPATALGIFIRDAGNTITTISRYTPTGIFYIPPNGATSGRIYVAQATPGNPFTLSDAGLAYQFYFDRVSAFGISAGGLSVRTGSLGAYTPVRSVNLYMRFRYFKGISKLKDYSSDPAVAVAAGAAFADISTTISVVLRDNIVGTNAATGAPNERPLNGLYFYEFTTPSLNQFNF